MKTKLLLVFVLLYSISQAQNTSIPDSNFENFLETRAADNSVVPIGDPTSLGDGTINGMVPTSKISGLTQINLFGQNILDLTGIEDFSSLTVLDAPGNDLNSLDVSMLPLTFLDVSGSNLNTINVSLNTELTHLDVTGNSLNTINVDDNTFLEVLYCGGNNFSSLKVDLNTALLELACGGMINLTALDLSKNIALERLVCGSSGLTNLNLVNNVNLIDLIATNCESLSTISLPSTPTLKLIQIQDDIGPYNSILSSIDVSMCPNLERFWCYRNNITGNLDVASNTKLVNFDCGYNNITTINMPNDDDTLTRFICRFNDLTTLDVSNNEVLTTFQCNNNLNMGSINLPTTNTLPRLDAYFTGVTSMDASGLLGLTRLYVWNNLNMTSMTLPPTNTLRFIDADESGLTSLDASSLMGLEFLDLWKCTSLSSLILPPTTSLTELYTFNSNLSNLDFVANTGLQYFDIAGANFTTIDISMLPNLIEFYCNESDLLEFLDISNSNNLNLEWMWAQDNPSLSCIQVDDVSQAQGKANWQKDAMTDYMTSCPPLSTPEFNKEIISLYPNPTNNIMHLKLTTGANYSLINPLGKVVSKGELIAGENQINVTNLTNGIYFLKVKSVLGDLTRKVLKK